MQLLAAIRFPRTIIHSEKIAYKKKPYAMWTGMGIVGTTMLGIFLFHEKLSVAQIICVILIVVGIAGLKILAKE